MVSFMQQGPLYKSITESVPLYVHCICISQLHSYYIIGFPAHFRPLSIRFRQFSIKFRQETLSVFKARVHFLNVAIHFRLL